MFYKIAEMGTHQKSDRTYLLVEFWRSKADYDMRQPPYLVNDFLMALRQNHSRVVTNADGWPKTVGGIFVDPLRTRGNEVWERESFTLDLTAEIKGNIGRYVASAIENKYEGDHTARPGLRGEFSKNGVVVRPAAIRVKSPIEHTGAVSVLNPQAIVALLKAGVELP